MRTKMNKLLLIPADLERTWQFSQNYRFSKLLLMQGQGIQLYKWGNGSQKAKQILQATGNISRRFQEMNAIHSVKQYK